jgi:hypothetical protein
MYTPFIRHIAHLHGNNISEMCLTHTKKSTETVCNICNILLASSIALIPAMEDTWTHRVRIWTQVIGPGT